MFAQKRTSTVAKAPGALLALGRAIRAWALAVWVLLLPAMAGRAATLTWTGSAGDGNIGTAGNWSPAQAPAAGDTLIFSGTAASLVPNLGTAGLSVASITFSGGTNAFILGGAGIYTVSTGGITNSETAAQTIANAIALSGTQTWASTSGSLVFDGTGINLGTALLTLSSGANSINISDPISGSGKIAKSGAGGLTLTGSNSFTGGLTLTTGTMYVGNSAALGSGTFTWDGGTVDVVNGSQSIANPVVIESTDTFAGAGGNLTFTGTASLTANKILTVNGGVVTFSNTIANGSGNDILTKKGVGTLVLGGSNTISGFTLTTGTVVALNNSVFGGGTLSLGTATLESMGGAKLFSNPVTLAGSTIFSGTDDITFTGNASMTGNRTITINNPVVAFDGVIGQSTGTARSLTVTGSGTLILGGSAANTYTGTTTVDNGLLELDKTAGVNAFGGPLTVGDSSGAADTAIAQLWASNQIPSTATVTIRPDGVLDLQTYSASIGTLSMTGGSIIGSGTLNLGGNVTTTAAGTLTTSISPNVTLNGSRTFTINNNSVSTDFDLTVSGNLSNGSAVGSLTKAGTGMLALTGSNPYSGGTTLTAGGLALGSNSAIGAGTLSLGTATLQSTDGGLTLSNPVILAGNPTFGGTGSLVFTGSTSLTGTRTFTINNGSDTFTGVISQSAAGYGFTQAGSGTLTLGGSAANSFTGTVTVNGGTLLLDDSAGTAIGGSLVVGNGSAAALVQWLGTGEMASTGSVTVNANGVLDLNGYSQVISNLTVGGGASITMESGTLSLTGGVTHNGTGTSPATIAGVLDLSGSNCTFSIGNSSATQDLVVTAVIQDGGITKSGAGLMALDAANLYGGATNVSQGTLQLGTSNAIASASAITISTGATLDLNGYHETAASLAGSGALTMESGTFSISGAATTTYTGSISGGGGIVINGGGMLSLGGTSTYTGPTIVNAGTLQWTGANGAAPGSDVTVAAGASVGVNGANVTIGSLTGAGSLVLTSGTLTEGGDNASTGFSGGISGPGGLVKAGAGLLTLSGSSSMTGSVTIMSGAATLTGSNGSLGSASGVTIDNGATFTIDNSSSQNSNRLADTASVTLAGGTFAYISGSNGSAETVGVLNAMSGASNVEVIQNGSASNVTSLTFSSLGTIGAGATVNFSGSGGVLGQGIAGTHIYILGQPDGLMGGWATVGTSFAQYYADGVSAFSNYYLGSDGINVNDATKIVELSGSSPSTASTLTNAGTTTDEDLNLADIPSVSLGTASTQVLNLASGGLIKSSTNLTTIAGAGELTAGGTASGALAVSVASGQMLTIASSIINNAGPDGIYGNADDGTVSLSVTEPGTLILTGSNSFSGNVYLNGGILQVSAGDNLGAPTNEVVFGGGTLSITSSVAGGAGQVFSIAMGQTGTLDVAAGQALTIGSASNLLIAGNSSTLVLDGSGTLIVPGSNSSFNGAVQVNAGTLQLQNALSLGGAATITLGGGALSLHNDNATNFGNAVVLTSNAGIDVEPLDGAGGVVMQSLGTLSIGAQTLTSTGSNGSSLGFGAVTLSGNATFNTASAAMTLGSISGAYGITKTGAATLILGGTSTYTGPTTINAGIVRLGSPSGVGPQSAVTVGQGASLDLNGNNAALASLSGSGNVTLEGATLSVGAYNASTTYWGILSGSGGLTKNGTGTFTLSGMSSYTGQTVINGGTLSLAVLNAIGPASAITVGYGAALNLNGVSETAGSLAGGGTVNLGSGGALAIGATDGNTAFSGGITGTGNLTLTGGTLALSGSDNFTGTVFLNGGILSIGSDSELGNSGNALNFGGGTLQAGAALTTSRAMVLSSAGAIDTGSNDIVVSGGISGVGPLTKEGSGELLISASNTFIGGTVLTDGDLVAENNAALGSGTVTFEGGGLSSDDDSITIANPITIAASTTNQILGNDSLTLTGSAGGTGMLNINLADVSKEVKLDPSIAGAFAPGGVEVTNGTLLLGRAQAIGSSTNLTLDGGTFSFQGLTGATQIMGSLTLLADSIIDFSDADAGGNTLEFTGLNLNGFTLTINDWSGDLYSIYSTTDQGASSQDRLLFINGTTGNNLSLVSFYDNTGTYIGNGKSVSDATLNEIVPVPEPSAMLDLKTIVALLGCRVGYAALIRKRKAARRN